MFRLDKYGYYSNDKSYLLTNGDYFLLGLLNSTVLWYLIASICPSVRGGFYEVRSYFIESLPIPKATPQQKAEVAALAEQCQILAEQRYALENGFRRRIPDLCPKDKDAKLSQKLQAWWEMDFAAFQAEIKKGFKQDIPLKERNEWQQWFEQDQTQIQQLNYQLAVKEQQLNQTVYALFGLNEAEVKLLEAAIA